MLTVDFDSVTGLNHVRVTTTDAFYANGSEFECVITAGTVDSVSVVGSCVGRFTLRSQASLYPTTAGNTLDVNANGEAGIDWANVGNPTTTLALTNTTIANVTVGTIATNAITAASITDGVIASEVWNASLASYNAGSSFGQRILRSSNAQSECDVSASAHIAADVHALQNAVITAASIATGAIDADALATDAVTEIVNAVMTVDPSTFPATSSGYWLYEAGLNSQQLLTDTNYINSTLYVESIADALLNRNIGGGSNSGRMVKDALRVLRNKTSITASTLTVYQEDDGATLPPAWTATLSTSASADPVTGIDPV